MSRSSRRAALAFVVAVVLAACGGGAASESTDGAGAEATGPMTFDELVAAANEEGVLYYADSVEPEMMAQVNERFNERFGTDITIELVSGRAADLMVRMQQEVQAGRVTIDGTHASTGLIFSAVDSGADMFDRFDYVNTFAGELEGIEDVVERVPVGLRGLGLEGTHLVRAVAYNTDLVPPDEVPTSWDELLEPQWKGQIALDPEGSSTYQNVAEWDAERTLQYSKDIAAQDPLWIEGDDIFLSVARGEAKVGIATMVRYGNVLFEDPDLPLALAPVEFYPVTQQMIFVAKNAPNVNAARLYAAWQATEGLEVFTELGQIRERIWEDSGGQTKERIAEVGVKTSMIESQEDLELADEVRDQIVEHHSTLGLGE